ncbi:PREDICTED: dystonin-like [Priapulus caudatus]|uniref:Dystonin-like n=1 Tax=Priapulus caudatus TaxID=37621 RepID=A0ABM1E7B7_PRICU|nr:PREDICTED: dystonin-like [Priapulus caudatus]
MATDKSQIEMQIGQQQALVAQICGQGAAVEQMQKTGRMLIALVSEDDRETIASRLADTQQRYDKLRDDCQGQQQLLQQGLRSLEQFTGSVQDFVSWLDLAERRMAMFTAPSVFVEPLERQQEQLNTLYGEVEEKAENYKLVMMAGEEVMRSTSGDEAMNVKNQLDNVRQRYTDLSNRGSDLSQQMNDALSFARQFHDSHNNISDWLLQVEPQLKSADAVGVEEQYHIIKSLEAELETYKAVMEAITESGARLMQLSPREGAYSIKDIMGRDKRRFEGISEQIQKRSERLRHSRAKLGEVTLDVDDMVEWFRGAETALTRAEPPSTNLQKLRRQQQDHRSLHDEIGQQRARARDLAVAARKLMQETSGDDQESIRARAEQLREAGARVAAFAADRAAVLEGALPLAETFAELHEELGRWLTAAEDAARKQEGATATLSTDAIKKQQDTNKVRVEVGWEEGWSREERGSAR